MGDVRHESQCCTLSSYRACNGLSKFSASNIAIVTGWMRGTHNSAVGQTDESHWYKEKQLAQYCAVQAVCVRPAHPAASISACT